MTDAEKILMVKSMTGETDDDTISAYLYMAGQKILRYAYPFDLTITKVPAQYEHVQLDAAAYLLNKRGAEGETGHSENGISRSYEDADLPTSMLRGIPRKCGAVE